MKTRLVSILPTLTALALSVPASLLSRRAASGCLHAACALAAAVGILSCPAGATTLLSVDFEGGTNGFAYQDDTFGTTQPAYASGSWRAGSGYSGGGLEVLLGGVDTGTVSGMSGGWTYTFHLDGDETGVAISFRYRLQQSATYKYDEYSRMLVKVNGVQHGRGSKAYIDQIGGDGSSSQGNSNTFLPTTGWQRHRVYLGELAAGSYTLVLGAYNNRKSALDETTLALDDVLITSGNSAPVTDATQTLVDRLDVSQFKAFNDGVAGFNDRCRLNGCDPTDYMNALAWVESQLQAMGYTTVRHNFSISGTTGVNLWATKLGTVTPTQMYMVSAHLDGRGGGNAYDDDASGVALVMEAARVFAGSDVQTDKSVRFIFWDREEIGKVGSRAYVADRRLLQGSLDEPTWLGLITHDMILYDHGVGTPGPDQSPYADLDVEWRAGTAKAADSKALALKWRYLNGTYATDYPANAYDDSRSTDDWYFHDYVASVSVRENRRDLLSGPNAEWINPHYHRTTDTESSYSAADVRLGFNAVQTTLGTVAELAGARIAPSSGAGNILTDGGFDSAGTDIGSATLSMTAHGAADTWLFGTYGTTTWDLSGGSALGHSPGAGTGGDAAALLQWVEDGKNSKGVGTISFGIDWSDIDATDTDLLDLSLFVFGWNDGDAVPQTDSISSFITDPDTFIPGDAVNLITDTTAAEGEFIVVQDNATTLAGLTKNDGFETITVNVDFGVAGYDNVGVMFYGAFGSVAGQDSGYFGLDDVSALSAATTPTSLAATPGDGEVDLSWNASSGATSYNVKRATSSGGAYTTIGSPAGTSYNDATAVNGTTYYYVVSAVNAGGESADLSEVSATPALSAASSNILTDGGFATSGTDLGNNTKTITAHGPASTWLYGNFNSGGTFWDLSGGSALGNSPVNDDSAVLLQWVADGKTSKGVGTISFNLDWSDIDPDNPPNTATATNLLDLSLFVFGWNDGDAVPQTDSINSFITDADTFIPGEAVNLITDTTAAEGEFIVVQDNATTLAGLTKNNGFETISVNVDLGVAGYDNIGVMFYGSFGSVAGQDSGYFDLDDVNLSAVPSASFAITSITSVGAGTWQLTLEGEAETTYEFRSSPTLDFDAGALVANLADGVPTVGTIGGDNDSQLTTDIDGNGTVRMTLAGPANFVVAQLPPPPPPLLDEGFEDTSP